MNLPNKVQFIFKVITSLVACVFLFQQIAWAGDLIEVALTNQYNEQSQLFAPSYLQNQQSNQENLINQKQSAENFSNLFAASSDTEPNSSQEKLALQGPKGGGVNAVSLSVTPKPLAAEPNNLTAARPTILQAIWNQTLGAGR
jgi:hypothetical protein